MLAVSNTPALWQEHDIEARMMLKPFETFYFQDVPKTTNTSNRRRAKMYFCEKQQHELVFSAPANAPRPCKARVSLELWPCRRVALTRKCLQNARPRIYSCYCLQVTVIGTDLLKSRPRGLAPKVTSDPDSERLGLDGLAGAFFGLSGLNLRSRCQARIRACPEGSDRRFLVSLKNPRKF